MKVSCVGDSKSMTLSSETGKVLDNNSTISFSLPCSYNPGKFSVC